MSQLFCQHSVSWKEHAKVVPLSSVNQVILGFTVKISEAIGRAEY